MNCFQRAICMTDIHFGLKNNSKQHNLDCIDFIDWFIDQAKLKNAETCIFLGDWGHHRSNINILTLNYTMDALRKLDNAFKKVYILVGNHDMFFREQRTVHGMVIASEFNNIELIENPTAIGDVTFVPWLVDDEWKTLSKMSGKYMFGHLELPGFKMNALIDMPDHGGINKHMLGNFDYIFSGHFHKRQCDTRVHYIGNPFGHNFSDSWDFDRGAMFLEWGGVPEYINYTGGPRYMSLTLSTLLSDTERYLVPKSYLQVTVDVDITYEEASFLRESFLETYSIRELKLIRHEVSEEEHTFSGDTGILSVDEIVISQLDNIDSTTYDTNKLIKIYNNL